MIKIFFEKLRPYIPMIIMIMGVLYYIDILAPFIISAVVAYLLNPLIKIMERKMKRGVALSIIMGVVILITVALLLVIIPGIINEAVTLINNMPDYLNKIKVYTKLNFPYREQIIEKIAGEMSNISKIILAKSTGIFIGGMTVLGYVVSVPIFTFYMLNDKETLCRFFWKFIPQNSQDTLFLILKKIDKRMQGFIKGQFLDFLALSVLLSIAFTIAGVRNGIAIALVCAMFNLIPYVGMVFSIILISGLTWFQSYNLVFVLKALAAFGVIQFFESMIMAPKLIGSNAKVHPLAIVLAIMIFGGTFGIAGVIFAIPGLIVIDEIMNIGKKEEEKEKKINLTD